MKPSSIRKVFGIISYFPDNDTDFHIETRRERSRRFRELLLKLEELWPDIDIMVIAQNWQDFELPQIKNNIIEYDYDKLGILGARRELRKKFLESDYDYLIMLDDDGRILNADPKLYIQTINEHPNGIGVIRHRSCPLMFLAISKFIYSQIDMPDIVAENGEGFEDDIFVAQCFARFPDAAYDFPKDCIEEWSLKYTGPGACPSTWSREDKYNWDHMRAYTNAKIYAIENPDVASDNGVDIKSSDIDAVVTYVNDSDTTWMKDYVRATKTHNPSATRYRSWGTLRYLFRSIAEYMPFIRNIVLVVAKESQVPVWINKEHVRVVYHRDFIPAKYLPTFNSCTIESFFWNIPDLAERIIYFNDDIFPNDYMAEDDFFTGAIPHIEFLYYENYKKTMFRMQCRAGLDAITKSLKLPDYPKDSLVVPEHTILPMVRENMIQTGTLCTDIVSKTTTRLRDKHNLNQYIYAYYQYFIHAYIPGEVKFKYFDLHERNFEEALRQISTNNYQVICLNDSDQIKDYPRIRLRLTQAFEKKFPNKCKYER